MMILAQAVGLAFLSGIAVAQEKAPLSIEVLLPSGGEKGDLDSYRPGAGFGKDVFLVVWQSGFMQNTDLVACRLDKAGKVLDAKPFVVCAAKDSQERPKVAFAKDVFLVVWQDIRNGKDYDTYAARVSPEGKVLDADGFLIAGGPGNQSRPRVTFDGANFLVAWEDMRDSKCYEVYGARVVSDGKVLDAGGVKLIGLPDKDKAGMDRYMPAVASVGDGRSLLVWCGTKYWVGWGTQAGSAFVRDGKVEKENAPFEKMSKDNNSNPGGGGRGGTPMSVAAGKEGYLVLWRNHRPVGRAGGGGGAGCAAFVDKDGNFEKAVLNLTGKPHIAMDPEAVWDGIGFVAAWGDQPSAKDKGTWESVVAAKTDSKGQPAGGAIQVSGTFDSPAARPAVASDGSGTTAIVYEKHPEKADVPIRIGFRLLGSK